jgi:hypothetical protein
MLAAASLAYAGEPCPWQDAANTAACSRWEVPLQRLEATTEWTQGADKPQARVDTKPSTPATVAGPEELRIRAIITRFLENLMLPLPESNGLEISRDYPLTQEDPVYIAHIPKAAWVKASVRLDFGPLRFRIQPHEGGLVTVNFSFGNLITLRENDTVLARLLIGAQAVQGVWDDTLDNFSLTTWQLGQIHLVSPGKAVSLTLNGATLNLVLSRSSDDTWKQRQTLDMTGLTVQLPDTNFSVDRMIGQIGMDGRDYPKMLSLRRVFTTPTHLNDAEATQRFLTYVDGMNTVFSHFDIALAATDVTLGKPQGPLTTIKRINIGNDFTVGKEPDPGLHFQLELADFQTQGTNMPTALVPLSARLEMGFFNMPANVLSQIMKITLASEQVAEEKQEDYLDQAFASLFLNSKLGLYLKDSYLVTPVGRLELSANSTINSKSAFGAMGEFNLQIEGFDKLLGSATLIDKQKVGPLLALLAALSNRTQANGKTVDSFALKLTEEGKLWLNGKDITALFLASDEADSG